MRLLAKSPADRFQSADEVDLALASVLEVHPVVSPSVLRWRRVAVVAAGVAALGWLGSRIVRGSPQLDAHRIMVFPLVERGGTSSAGSAGEIAALMISTTLSQAEPLRGFYGWTALTPQERADPRLIRPESARRIARGQRAQFYIQGWIVEEEDSLAVILSLNHASGSTDPVEYRAADRRGVRTPTQLAMDAMVHLLPSLLEHPTDLSILRARNPAAIAEFLLGEVDYYRSRFGNALGHYQKAIAADSLLAIAAVQGAQAASWAERPQEAVQLLAVAKARLALLPARYGDIINGLAAYYAGRADSAVFHLKRAIAGTPDWSEASMALGEVYRHLLPTEVPLDSLARAAFSKAAALDRGLTAPLYHLAELAVRRGDTAEAWVLLNRLAQAHPDSDMVLPLSFMQRCIEGKMPLSEWRKVAVESWDGLIGAALVLAAPEASPECATDAFRAMLGTRIEGNYRPQAYYALQSLLAMRGRTEELRSLVNSDYGRQFGGMWYLILSTAAGAPFGREVDSLVQSMGENYAAMGTARLWFIGLRAAQRGARQQLRAIETALTAQANGSGAPVDRLFADIIAARSAVVRGDTAGAIRRLSALTSPATRVDAVWSPFLPLSLEHLTLAQLRYATGDYPGALMEVAWFDAPAPPVSSWLCVPGAFVIGVRAAERIDRKDLATRYRGRLRRLGREALLQ